MPITPQFHLSQTPSHVSIEIRVPHVRVSVDSVEVLVEGDTLHFSSPPYLLILTFPGQFAETDSSESAKYDPSREGGMIFMDLKKQEPELWPDLDLLGNLMRPKGPPSFGTPMRAQIVSEEQFEGVVDDADEEALPPNVLDEDRPHYGFLNQMVGIFTDLVRDGLAAEMLQLPNPDETDAEERRTLRLETENKAFDADRYLGDVDIEEDYIYESAMAMKPHWAHSVESLINELSTISMSDQQPDYFSQEEQSTLASIAYPILPATIDDQQERSLLLGLLDLLFAYVYDHLVTDGDPGIESSWTVCTLSCTLSWLESFGSADSVRDVIRFSSRRSLIYPYIRNYEFTKYCWDQVAVIVKNGRRCLIRCILQMRAILDKSEFHYLGNRLYLDPYLLWIQSRLSDTKLKAFSKELLGIRTKTCWIEKDALELNLVHLEQLLNEESIISDDDDSDSDDDDTDGETDESDCVREEADEGKGEKADAEGLIVSSALLDSEIGSLGMLKIDDEGITSAPQIPQTPSAVGKSLIQEL
ncbi:SHQ1 protein [Fragilaria crotonensis]|nr:SHQ1 protein [Fragilaria crotonensis]